MSSKALLRFAFAAVFTLLLSLPVFAESHVRIVRLSYIEGGVTIDRNTGQFEKAIVNLPITEGTKLRTADGRAEVEFEDGSTMRLAPSTNVQFTKLSLQDSGGKISVAEVQSGTVYVDFAAAKHDELTLQFGHAKTTLTQAAHLRIDANEGSTALAVFKGDVQVEDASDTVHVKKNQTVSFDAGENAKAVIAKNIEPEPLDSWDKKQSEYHQVYASNSYTNYSPYAYGTSDLAYYGNFFSAPGYGMLWQPYFIGAGWDPFMNGAWAFSPGFGYGWVSSYPWGWVPYHYGTWVFLPGYGWAWQPGGAWMPYYSTPMLLNTPNGFKRPQPPAAPVKGTSILAVNRGPVTTFANRSGSKIMIQNNSAGLGVPRGLSNIAKVSQQVQTKGMVTQRIPSQPSMAPPRSMMQPGMQPGMRTGMARGEGQARPAAPPRMSSPPPPPPAPRMSAPPPPPPSSPHR
jgi:hypothetical protein